MKYVHFFIFVVIFVTAYLSDSNVAAQNILSKNRSGDTSLVIKGGLDTIKYKIDNLEKVINDYPQLNTEYTTNPDLNFAERNYVDSDAQFLLSFSSEAGQDEYYFLYAYFLSFKNGVEKYSNQRKKIVEIYREINGIYATLNHGGTYFGHQYLRILGYAEYSIYKYKLDSDGYIKPYSFIAQKRLFIASLKQYISNEVDNDNEILDKKLKAKSKKQLFDVVEKIDSLITSYFYLSEARQFNYAHYQY